MTSVAKGEKAMRVTKEYLYPSQPAGFGCLSLIYGRMSWKQNIMKNSEEKMR